MTLFHMFTPSTNRTQVAGIWLVEPDRPLLWLVHEQTSYPHTDFTRHFRLWNSVCCSGREYPRMACQKWASEPVCCLVVLEYSSPTPQNPELWAVRLCLLARGRWPWSSCMAKFMTVLILDFCEFGQTSSLVWYLSRKSQFTLIH